MKSKKAPSYSKNIICIRFVEVCESLIKDKKVKSFNNMAESIGMYSQHFYNVLSFKAKPTLVQLEKLHKAYNVNMNYIFNKSNKMFLS